MGSTSYVVFIPDLASLSKNLGYVSVVKNSHQTFFLTFHLQKVLETDQLTAVVNAGMLSKLFNISTN